MASYWFELPDQTAFNIRERAGRHKQKPVRHPESDNLAGGRGRLPNAQQFRRMIELVESTPSLLSWDLVPLRHFASSTAGVRNLKTV